MFNVTYKRYETVTVATIHTARVIDTAEMTAFGDEILAFLEDHPDTHLLLNFSKVDFMSSAMLTELLRINELVRRQRGSMRLCGLRKEMRHVFKLTKLDGVFHIEDDCKSGLKKYHADVKANI